MKNLIIIMLLASITSCSQKAPKKILVEKVGLDLEKISFNEDPQALLKGKIDSTENATADFVKEGISDAFDYPTGHKVNKWNGDQSLYGKAYYSKANDSIAHYKDLYFKQIAFLTHQDSTVAVLATAEVTSDTVYPHLIEMFNAQLGEPSFRTPTSTDNFYEWTGKDRYVQIDYSTGGSITVIPGEPVKTENVYTIKFLIFNKSAADEIKKIQDDNYRKTKKYTVLYGDFEIYRLNPDRNVVMMSDIMFGNYK